MIKKVIFILLIPVLLYAEKKDSTKSPWESTGIAGLNISQVSFSDWAPGGEDNLTYSLTGNFKLNYKGQGYQFNNSLKIAYGQTKLGDKNFKTNDNEFYMESVYSRQLGWAVDPYISNTIRTYVAPGIKITDGKEYRVSAFFDPGYVSQSLGFTYDKLKAFQTRLGVGLQETFTNKYTQYSDDPETKDEVEKFKLETGIESVTDVELSFWDNMMLKSKLRFFTRFDAIDVWDVRWDNTISAQVNKYIVVNLNFLLVYEKSQSPYTQIKEALQLGLTYTLF